ncbi:MAG: class I SAM-dependent methyltransferase [Methylocella sp.]
MTAEEVFGRDADVYDHARWQLVHCYDDFYGAAVELVASRIGKAARILDLGAGTAIFSSLVRDRMSDAQFTLVDCAPEMIAHARQRLGTERISYVLGDIARDLPEGPYDAVISALAIHHLDDAGKQCVYHHSYRVLAEGGAFVNADQCLGPTPARDLAYWEYWHRRSRERGIQEADLKRAVDRMQYDRMSPIPEQLDWLKTAGFKNVDCVYKSWSFAVVYGET